MQKNYHLLFATMLLLPNLLQSMEEKLGTSTKHFQELLQKKKELKQQLECATDNLEKLLETIYTTQELDQKKALAEKCLEMAITLYKANKEKFFPNFDNPHISDEKKCAMSRRYLTYTRAIEIAQLFNIPIQREDHDALLIGIMANDTWYAGRLHKSGANPTFSTHKKGTALSLAESTLKSLQSETQQDPEKIGLYKFLCTSFQKQQLLQQAKPTMSGGGIGTTIFRQMREKQENMRKQAKQLSEKTKQLLNDFTYAESNSEKASIAQTCITNAQDLGKYNTEYNFYKEIIVATLEFNNNIQDPLFNAVKKADSDFVQTLLTKGTKLAYQTLDKNKFQEILESNQLRLAEIIIPEPPQRDSSILSASYEEFYQRELANYEKYIESSKKEQENRKTIQKLLEQYTNGN